MCIGSMNGEDICHDVFELNINITCFSNFLCEVLIAIGEYKY